MHCESTIHTAVIVISLLSLSSGNYINDKIIVVNNIFIPVIF